MQSQFAGLDNRMSGIVTKSAHQDQFRGFQNPCQLCHEFESCQVSQPNVSDHDVVAQIWLTIADHVNRFITGVGCFDESAAILGGVVLEVVFTPILSLE